MVTELLGGRDAARAWPADRSRSATPSRIAQQIGRRPRGRPREGDRPPGREARERLPDEGRPRQAPRLRPRSSRRLARRDETHAHRRSTSLTRGGVVVGTVAYMSPEQARGQTVDYRERPVLARHRPLRDADGKAPFRRGDSAAETLTAIIREEREPLTKLARSSRRSVGWIVQRCLAKDPEERYSSTKDLAKELRNSGLTSRRKTERRASLTAKGSSPRRVPYWALAEDVELNDAVGLFAGIRFHDPRLHRDAAQIRALLPRGRRAEDARTRTGSPSPRMGRLSSLKESKRRLRSKLFVRG